MVLRYLSLFSGVGGLDLGFDRAGMVCAGQVEKDAKCRAVLERHWPGVPRMADIREVQGDEFGAIDVVCGGFPCQDVSLAGRRDGLAGERSGLWFEFHRLVDRVQPGWVIVENVPGLLSSRGGRDFATILQGLVECGYGVAWRILDAQYFGVPQQRRRVFIVASLGSGRCAQVLFESEGGGGNTAPGREAGKELATDVAASLRSGGAGLRGRNIDAEHGLTIAAPRVARQAKGGFTDPVSDNIIATPFNGYTGGADDNDAQGGHLVACALTTESHATGDGSGCGNPIVALPLRAEGHDASEDGTGRQNLVTAFTERGRAGGRSLEMQTDVAYALTNPGDGGRAQDRQIAGSFGVRRLTPTEYERLQGFPDGHTAHGADGPQSDSARYRQLGNAVAVPVAEWVGRRIIEGEMRDDGFKLCRHAAPDAGGQQARL